MCTMVGVIMPDGEMQMCDTVQALADALGVNAETIAPDSPPDYCLCNVHLSALGARLSTADEGSPWPEFVINTALAKDGA